MTILCSRILLCDVLGGSVKVLLYGVLVFVAGVTKPYILSVVLSVGDVLLMSSYDDVCPKVIHTGLSGEILVFFMLNIYRPYTSIYVYVDFSHKLTCCHMCVISMPQNKTTGTHV